MKQFLGKDLTPTEYLFGNKLEEYEPELSSLVHRRIRDARAVLRELALMKLETKSTRELDEMIKRYEKVEAAIETWQKIAEQEEL